MYQEEQNIRNHGFPLIAGVDEAGRGPLAGPVVAAAVILPADYRHPGINDSKKLTPLQREDLFEEITHHAVSWAVAAVSAAEIDKTDILIASKKAMRQAVQKLDPPPDFVLTDAVALNIPGIPQKAIIKGDATVFVIAAASILAKVTRDRLMRRCHDKYPQYGFDSHMGYGTELHLSAIKKHGPCPLHRISFAPFSD